MTIQKLEEFAVNGDKSITGLNLTTGFPRQQKPFRQWMNYLFNWSTVKLNEVIDEVNNLNLKIQPLLKPIAIGEGFFTVNDYKSASEVAAAKGYGTWVRFAEGRTLVGYSSTTANGDQYRIMGNEFGANTHKLTVAESPKHKHSVTAYHEYDRPQDTDPDGYFAINGLASSSNTVTHSSTELDNSKMMRDGTGNSLGSIGSDQPHNNIQPSIVVAYWLRTA